MLISISPSMTNMSKKSSITIVVSMIKINYANYYSMSHTSRKRHKVLFSCKLQLQATSASMCKASMGQVTSIPRLVKLSFVLK